MTPLCFAVEKENFDIVDLLIKSRANLEAADE